MLLGCHDWASLLKQNSILSSHTEAEQTQLQHLSRRPNSDWWRLMLTKIKVFSESSSSDAEPTVGGLGVRITWLAQKQSASNHPVLSDLERKSSQRWHKKPLLLEWFSYHSPKHPSVERRAEVLLKTPDVRIWWNNNRQPNPVKLSLPQLA